MKTNFKLLALIFALALTSTSKVESKVTFNGVITGYSIYNSIIMSLATYYYLSVAPKNEKMAEKLVEYIYKTLIAWPTLYCLYKKTENNTFLPLANGMLCITKLYSTIRAHEGHKILDQADQSFILWVSGKPYNEEEYISEKNLYIISALISALTAYQLNR
jgi:hypothetical protein